MTVTSNVLAELIPGVQARDWQQRWIEIQAHFQRLTAPQPGGMSGPAIQTAQHELRSFLVQAYHLKDALVHDEAATGVPGNTVEAAITNEPPLALLADMANLEKHQELTVTKKKGPRSGHVPTYGRVSGVTVDGGWRLSLEIQRNGRTLDGLTVAREATAAWERQLQQWGLI